MSNIEDTLIIEGNHLKSCQDTCTKADSTTAYSLQNTNYQNNLPINTAGHQGGAFIEYLMIGAVFGVFYLYTRLKNRSSKKH